MPLPPSIAGEAVPVTISDKGVEVLPLSSMELTQKSSNIRVSTGNAELDKMCGGGFYRDSIILVSGATGCGKGFVRLKPPEPPSEVP